MIAILGGRGFLGSAIARHCAQTGREHVVITRDNYAEHVGLECDVLINANGNSRKYLAREKPLEDFDASVRSVRRSLIDFQFATYVLVSSCDVYPDSSQPASSREDMPLDPARQTPYGFHKYLAECCVRHAAKRWLILRGGGFVGPQLFKNVIYDVLHGNPLWVNLESEFQFLHVRDAATALFELLEKGVSNETINLSATGVVRVDEVCTWAGQPPEVRPGSPLVKCEIALDKLAQWTKVPLTRPTIQEFIAQARGAAGTP